MMGHHALGAAAAALETAEDAFKREGDEARARHARDLRHLVLAEDPDLQDRVWRCLEPDRGMRPEQVGRILSLDMDTVWAVLSVLGDGLVYMQGALVRQRGGWYRSVGERAPSSYGPGEVR